MNKEAILLKILSPEVAMKIAMASTLAGIVVRTNSEKFKEFLKELLEAQQKDTIPPALYERASSLLKEVRGELAIGEQHREWILDDVQDLFIEFENKLKALEKALSIIKS